MEAGISSHEPTQVVPIRGVSSTGVIFHTLSFYSSPYCTLSMFRISVMSSVELEMIYTVSHASANTTINAFTGALSPSVISFASSQGQLASRFAFLPRPKEFTSWVWVQSYFNKRRCLSKGTKHKMLYSISVHHWNYSTNTF